MGFWGGNQKTEEPKFTVFCCEDTVDGIFTAVYEAWASKRGLNYVTVQVGENQNFQLFTEYKQVETDQEKANKVGNTIRQKMGMEDYETLYYAALSRDSEKGEAIFRTIVFGLAVSKRRNVTRNLQEPCIAKVFELSRRVGNESHRYRMFVRFHELAGEKDLFYDIHSDDSEASDRQWLERSSRAAQMQNYEELKKHDQEHLLRICQGIPDDTIMFSEIEPENQVLPLLGEHFSDRFPMVNFMIYDKTHNACLIHQAGKQWVILQDANLDEERIHRYSRREQEFSRLWKGFVQSIAIEERKNPRCQMNFMPKKFWKYMTEHQ